jgi:hypothetical protein
MSAFVVSHDHIDALLSFAKDKRMLSQLGYYIQPSKADQFEWTDVGRVLLAENDRSVCHRYSDCSPGGEEVTGYTFRYFEPFAHMQHTKKCVWVIKNCDCFDYQACETDDYPQTVAHRIIAAIRAAAIRGLPDYETAPWGIDRGRSAA